MGPFTELLRILGACTFAGALGLALAHLLRRLDLLPSQRPPEARKGLRKER